METEQKTTFTAIWTTNCLCKECPKCSEEQGIWIGEETNCYLCGGEFEYSQLCFECDEQTREDFLHFAGEWHDQNENAPYVIEGKGMTWRNLSGRSVPFDDIETGIKSLIGDYDLTLRLTYDPVGNSLTVRRSSHDEPMGAVFTFKRATLEDIENDHYGNINELYRWSMNFTYPTPFSLFLDIIGYSDYEIGERLVDRIDRVGLGYMELDYLGDALTEYAHNGSDAYEYVRLLVRTEN